MPMLFSWQPKFKFFNSIYHPASKFIYTPPPHLSVKNLHPPECSKSLFHQVNQSVSAIVFGDGSSPHSKLYPLTKRRSEAAIPIAGNYRLIDAVISNCINSGITKIYAITQFNSTSLNSHISRAYSASRLLNDGFVEVIAAYQSPEGNDWFQGTADAIRRCLWMLEEYPVAEFLVLPGHHLYKMDYHELLDAHRRSKADITISMFSRRKNEDFGFNIFELSSENQVVGFRENAETLRPISVEKNNLINFDQDLTSNFSGMGIYVINRDVMVNLLTEYFPTANDLHSQVIPGAISLGMKVHGYGFNGYWEDMRSIEAYYQANMDTLQRNKTFSLYNRDSPLYTLPRHLPPTLVADAVISDSFIGDGCILSKCRIKGSVVGMRTRVGNYAVIEDSVIMGSDTYNHNGQGTSEGEGNGILIGIGEGSYVRKAIVDKNARIGKNVKIINRDSTVEGNMEANGYIISGGIIVIIRSAVIPDGSIL